MSGLGIAAAVILGPAAVFLAIAIGLHCHCSRQRFRGGHAGCENVRRALDGNPPPAWDSCIVTDPKDPQQGGSE